MTRRCTATTNAGEPCKRDALRDTVPPVCMSHTGNNGAQPIISRSIQREVFNAVRAGLTVKQACELASISVSAFYLWMHRGDPAGTAPVNEPYRTFRAAVEQARGERDARRLARVAAASVDDWRAAAWILERHFPEKWGTPGRRVVDSATADPEDDGPVAA